jgi:hypothetical protein
MKWSILLLGLVACGRAQVALESSAALPPVTNSLEAYTQFVYPMVKENCASCHANNQSPLFASDNAKDSHDLLIETAKVDFADPANSRLYLRLSVDSHNCFFGGDCTKSAEKMLDGIQEWAKYAQLRQEISVQTAEFLVPAGLSASVDTPVSFELKELLSTTQSVLLAGNLRQFDPETYVLQGLSLRVVGSGAPNEATALAVQMKGLQFLVNSKVDPTANTFALFDEQILAGSTAARVSRNPIATPAVLIPVSRGPGVDRIAIGFENLRLVPRVGVVLDLVRINCMECHAGNQPGRINLSTAFDEESLINIVRDYDGAGARPPWPLVVAGQPLRSPLSLAMANSNRFLPASTNPAYSQVNVTTSGAMAPNSSILLSAMPSADRDAYRAEMKRRVDAWINNIGRP